jgi:hypothetical protein
MYPFLSDVVFSLQNLGVVQTKGSVIHSSRIDHIHTKLRPTNKIGISIKHGNSGTCFVSLLVLIFLGTCGMETGGVIVSVRPSAAVPTSHHW